MPGGDFQPEPRLDMRKLDLRQLGARGRQHGLGRYEFQDGANPSLVAAKGDPPPH